MSDHVVELSLRYSDCIARAEKAEAELARLRELVAGIELDREVMTGAGGRSSVSTALWEELLGDRSTSVPSPPTGKVEP